MSCTEVRKSQSARCPRCLTHSYKFLYWWGMQNLIWVQHGWIPSQWEFYHLSDLVERGRLCDETPIGRYLYSSQLATTERNHIENYVSIMFKFQGSLMNLQCHKHINMHAHRHTCTHTYACMHTYSCTHTRAYMHVCTHVYTHTHTYIHAHMHVHSMSK